MIHMKNPPPPAGLTPDDSGLPLNVNKALGTISSPLESPYPKNTLSIVMIVKNEAQNVRDAIESFQPIADEIIVNDTGSTDGTQDILNELKVTWFQTQWENDFSLARNQSVERANASWVLWMDADDRLPSEQIENFLRLKTAPLDRVFGFQVINTQAGQPWGSRFMQIRMFPNHPKIRFERPIHEQIIFSAAKLGLHVFYTETTLYHTGYESEEKKKQKAMRNLSLAEQQKDLQTEDPVFCSSLGDSYFILEEWQKGILAFKQAFEHPDLEEINADVFKALPNNIGMGFQKLGQYDKAISWFEKAVHIHPQNLEPVFHLGEVHQCLGNTDKAADLYRKVIHMPLTFSSTGNQFDALRIYSYHHLARLLHDKGRYQEVVDLLSEMHQSYTLVLETHELMGDSHFALEQYEKAIIAWSQCIRLGPGKLISVYTKLYNIYIQTGAKTEADQLLTQARKFWPDFASDNASPPEHIAEGSYAEGCTLCMIVKNESECLPNCLSSTAGLFNKIIIVDTGSTDNSKEIAKQFGSQIIETIWENDFSKARNLSLSAAQTRWTMWLDADDVIPTASIGPLRQLIKQPASKAFSFLIQNTQNDGHTGDLFNQIRLFPTGRGIRFTSPIHEQILPALEKAGIPVEYTSIKIHHTGYADAEATKKKQQRNRNILEKQVKDNDNVTPVTLYSLANAYMDLGDPNSAIPYYMDAVELAEKTNTDPHIIEIGPVKTASALATLKRFDEALNVIQISLNQASVPPEAILVKAQIDERVGRMQQALSGYIQLLEVEESPTFIPVDYGMIKIQALNFLGKYWHQQGKRNIAVELLKRGIAIQNGTPFSKTDYQTILNQFG